MKIIGDIFVREILILKSRSSAWILILVIPTIIFFYLGAIYEQGAIQTVPVAILDHDQSAMSLEIKQNIEASPKLEIIKYLSSGDDPEKIFTDYPEIKGLYYIPKNFSKNVLMGSQEKLVVYTNSANIIYGNLLYKEAALFINTLSSAIVLESLVFKGIPYHKAMKMVMPVMVETRPLFNPYYNYLYYLVPGLTTVLLQMIVFFLSTRSINSEFTNHTFTQLFELSNKSVFHIIFGKLLAYSTIGMIVAILIFAVIHPLLGIPVSPNTIRFLPIVLIFVMANSMLGIMISSIFKNEAIAMDMAFVYNSPAFVFSGFTFPLLAMPAFNSWYANLIPYTHFLKAFIKGIEMNSPIAFLIPQIIILLIFFTVAYIISVVLLSSKLKKIGI